MYVAMLYMMSLLRLQMFINYETYQLIIYIYVHRTYGIFKATYMASNS